MGNERHDRGGTAPTVSIATHDTCTGLMLEQTLKPRGLRTQRLRDREGLRRSLESDSVDVVLVDVDLESDGVAVMEELTRSGVRPRCGWLALVEPYDDWTRERAVDAGAAGCCVKPCYPREVRRCVSRLLALSHPC